MKIKIIFLFVATAFSILLEGPDLDTDKIWPKDYFKAKREANYTSRNVSRKELVKNFSNSSNGTKVEPLSLIKIKKIK